MKIHRLVWVCLLSVLVAGAAFSAEQRPTRFLLTNVKVCDRDAQVGIICDAS